MNVNALIISKDPSDPSKKYCCNICDDIILNDTIIGLHCDPDKHIFCYQCILDWYYVLKKNTQYGNYQMVTMCPICKKNGGKLPICNNVIPVNGIHNMKRVKLPKSFKPVIICGTFLKSDPSKKCSMYGHDKYGGKCYRHKNQELSEDNSNNNSEILNIHLCNAPLKTKKGHFCKSIGSHKYAGRCGKHETIPPDQPEELITVI